MKKDKKMRNLVAVVAAMAMTVSAVAFIPVSASADTTYCTCTGCAQADAEEGSKASTDCGCQTGKVSSDGGAADCSTSCKVCYPCCTVCGFQTACECQDADEQRCEHDGCTTCNYTAEETETTPAAPCDCEECKEKAADSENNVAEKAACNCTEDNRCNNEGCTTCDQIAADAAAAQAKAAKEAEEAAAREKAAAEEAAAKAAEEAAAAASTASTADKGSAAPVQKTNVSTPEAAEEAVSSARANTTITLTGEAAKSGITADTAKSLYGKKDVKVKVKTGSSFYTVNSKYITSEDAVVDVDINVKRTEKSATVVIDGTVTGVSEITASIKLNKALANKILDISVDGEVIAKATAVSTKVSFELPAEYVGKEITITEHRK